MQKAQKPRRPIGPPGLWSCSNVQALCPSQDSVWSANHHQPRAGAAYSRDAYVGQRCKFVKAQAGFCRTIWLRSAARGFILSGMKQASSTPRTGFKTVALAALLAVVPAPASATTAYERFSLTDAEHERFESDAYVRCMDASGGVTIHMRDCSAAEHDRLDVQLNSVYRTAMARLPSQAMRFRLRDLERSWLVTRWDSCKRRWADETGTLGLVLVDACLLSEMQRRIAWLERYGR